MVFFLALEGLGTGSAWSGFEAPVRPAGCWYFISMASQIYSLKFAKSVGWSFLSSRMQSLQSWQPAPFLLHNIKNKVKIPNREMGQRSQWIFHEEGIHMAIKNLKRCSVSLMVRGRQVKSPMSYHLTSVRMAISENLQQYMLPRMWRKGNAPALLVRM